MNWNRFCDCRGEWNAILEADEWTVSFEWCKRRDIALYLQIYRMVA